MTPAPEDVQAEFARLNREAEEGGYHLNPDPDFTLELVNGLLVNTDRYGYPSCPCRLTGGSLEADRDIICPCDYRDPDLDEYGTCYCGLYVSRDVVDGKRKIKTIPERRPPGKQAGFLEKKSGNNVMNETDTRPVPTAGSLPYPVWRCNVCGYLCARDHPPETCPVCKAKKDRFSRFL